MVLKKKKEIQVDAFILECQELETLRSFADAEDQNLASLLLHCVQLSDGIHQIYSMKQIVTLLKKMDRNSACSPMIKCCLDIIGVMYFSLGAKNPLKKMLASSLNGLPEQLTTEAVHSFVRCLKEELKTTDLCLYRKVMDNLASCMENFSLGKASINNLFKEVLQFLQKSVLEIQEENRQLSGNSIVETRLMHDLLMAIKVSMMLLQKVQENFQGSLWRKPGSLVWQSMCGLLKSFTNFLMNEGLLPTVQTTSGLAVILFTKTMFEPVEKLPCLVSDLLLRSVKCASVPEWFVSSCECLCTEELSDSVLLSLCHGALAMLEWKNGSMSENGEKLLLDIALVLLSLASRLKESNMAVSLSRILAIWTNSALDVLESSSQNLKSSLNGNSNTTGKLLEYVYTHWEHPLDAVRHQAKLIFKNILRIHQATLKGSVVKSGPFFSMLTESLLSLEWHVKGKYASLGCLVECVGVENILTVDRTIPAQILDVMGDQSLAPYASDLLETMFINHKSHLISAFQKNIWINHWHDTWVSPLLLILCEGNPDQTTYVIDYYLPKLLKCSPDSLSYMIKILQASADANIGSCNTRGALGALMACLRTARAHGHLQFREIVRDDLLSIGCVKQGLVHQHNQVRVDALGLLCETHRSTEILTMEEMQLIQFFITYNLNSQSPAVRQQICSLLKKLFCRIQESSQVLYKLEQSKTKQELIKESAKWDHFATLQQYKDFMSSICDKLFEALFPGSSHPTRFSSLTILGSIAEIFSAPEGQTQAVFRLAQEIDPTRVQMLIQCFASTFEEVKVLAFELLMKLYDRLDLQDFENLHLLFQAAMDLSISTKPYDCVTASYLLNFLIHHKGLLNVCLKNQQVADTFQIDEDMSASTMEKNTLAVIKYLLSNLEREIFQAEKSLLQAAASFPMYGRVHCITGALQQLPLNNLTLMTEWRQMVTKLILMSYRLSSVVSPIVQSSSPEGLIPMDNDSETAGRLQMILHEIQPRDTNDYFTQAKILKEHHRVDFAKLTDDEPVENVCTEIRGKEGQTCDVTAQMVLVCCWRSMKEISLLLGMLCKLLPLQTVSESSDGLIAVEQVKDIGDYFKHHLLQSRHRGAFELAYTGFVMLTEILSRCTNESLRTLPQQWLYNVLEEIKSCDPSSKLCATRRSAGIPFYIQALLASEPKNKTNLLKMTMNELVSLAVPVNESLNIIPQVHALNILRALFRDTRFGENIIPYIADGIQAAVLGFTSPVWAVRNSSTLLFSTLITRIFGVKRGKDENSKKNRMTGREFFSRFPTLYPFLLQQLEVVARTMDSETGELKLHPSLFLLLLILGKLYPSPMDGTYSALSMAPFVPFIMRQNPCLVTRAAYLDVLVVLSDYLGKSRRKGIELFGFWEEISKVISASELMTGIYYFSAIPGFTQYLQSITKLIISVLSVAADPDFSNSSSPVAEQMMNSSSMVVHLLQSDFHEVRLPMLETVLLWWKQVNSKQATEEKMGPLSLLSDLEVILLRMAMKEKHPECFCKVLEILHCMDLRNVLPRTQDSIKMNPKEFLNWAMNIISASDSIKIQSIALKLASKLVTHLVQNCQEVMESEMRQWIQLVTSCCGDEEQTAIRLAAAEVLINITPLFLTNQKLILGLSSTLAMWKCVVLLLQSEELIVRDTAADVIRVAQSQSNICNKTEFAFRVVNASMALDLAFGILCELLQQWNQTSAGVPVLLEWLLGEDEQKKDLETTTLMEDDNLFNKGEVNFWAETLTNVRQLSKHLFLLIPATRLNLPDQGEFLRLARRASDQAKLVTQHLKELPPTPEFSKTVEFTRLAIQNERISTCLKILTLLELDDDACKNKENPEK
ncbi:thyroid adenoma-associated protein isoform X5 [Gopherus flavomarginatus]|uniref:thyroid adenoma-associated protein isoform X5 n=1 Tax=Gopherus flavomarginatus TaxID=286002 RepID=UPI0021CC2D72|nr:thyroid adenoma-associated protein isoform X5 [Gopherus flavomarginatus]